MGRTGPEFGSRSPTRAHSAGIGYGQSPARQAAPSPRLRRGTAISYANPSAAPRWPLSSTRSSRRPGCGGKIRATTCYALHSPPSSSPAPSLSPTASTDACSLQASSPVHSCTPRGTANCYGRVDKSGKWKPERSNWFIVEPWEKLSAKYVRGTAFAYDHYVFNGRHPQPNRITDLETPLNEASSSRPYARQCRAGMPGNERG
jgi:hypothetical protein